MRRMEIHAFCLAAAVYCVFWTVDSVACEFVCIRACWLQRNDNDVSVWLYKEENREWAKRCLTPSVFLQLTVLPKCLPFLYFSLGFGQLGSFVHLPFSPVIPLFSFSSFLLPAPFLTVAGEHACLHPSVFGFFLLSQAWHCAMVVEGLCPEASWLWDWDVKKRLDPRREVKLEKSKKGAIRTEVVWRGAEEGKDGLQKPSKGKVECRGIEPMSMPSFQCNLWSCRWVWDQHDG